nr:hypothetical protein [Tanacetum cinerariifolium]
MSSNFYLSNNENYLCNLYENNSHDGYDCQQRFLFVYKQEPSYNQNYDGNYYSHNLPSFPCCDYCGGSHETYQCQPIDHNIYFSGSDQIQNPQYPDVQENPLTNDEFEAFMKANDDKMNDLEITFDQFQKQCEQMQDDLLNQMRNFIQNFQNGPPGEDKEHEATTDTELFSNEDIQPLSVQESPQNSDMHHIIEGHVNAAITKVTTVGVKPRLVLLVMTLDVCTASFTQFIEDVITEMIDYHLFDVVVEFHRNEDFCQEKRHTSILYLGVTVITTWSPTEFEIQKM